MNLINQLKAKWLSENIKLPSQATPEDVFVFESNHNALLPSDLVEYFTGLNGTHDEYDGNLFQFYSLNQVKSIVEEFKDWKGIPDFGKASEILKDADKYFVFANYSFNLFAYAIRLTGNSHSNNEIIVLCGKEYRQIASTFSDFITLYLKNSAELYFSNIPPDSNKK